MSVVNNNTDKDVVATTDVIKDDNGHKLYWAFKVLRSQFWTVCTKHIVVKSGKNEQNMIDCVFCEVWAERHNNELRKKSKKVVACASQCPPVFVPLERATFATYWDHPILKGAKSPLTDEGGANFGKALCKGIKVMSCAEQLALKQKAASNTNNGNDNNSIIEQMKKQHIEIATRQAVAIECQNNIIMSMMMEDSIPALLKQLVSNLTTTTNNNNNNKKQKCTKKMQQTKTTQLLL